MIYRSLFTLPSYFPTKESYDWWIIRRKWRFKQQISKEKSKIVGRKYLGALKWILQLTTWAAKISQAESIHFARKG